MDRHYDIAIIGSGPAGLSAALYIKRAGLTCAVIGKDGGALEKAEKIENYFGTGAIFGAELVKQGVEQAKELGADIFREEVFSLGWNGDYTVSSVSYTPLDVYKRQADSILSRGSRTDAL